MTNTPESPTSSPGQLRGQQPPLTDDAGPALSDKDLASRYGATWAAAITARELKRAKQKDAET